MAIATILVLALVLGGSTYYLFFAPVPFIESFSATELERVSQISDIDLKGSLSVIGESPVFKVLESHVGLPSPGSFGRDNPFISFLTPQADVVATSSTPAE